MLIRVCPVSYASVCMDFPATLHENEPGRCTMQPARWKSEYSDICQIMFASLNRVRKDFAGSISLWAQKVLYSVPSNLDLVK